MRSMAVVKRSNAVRRVAVTDAKVANAEVAQLSLIIPVCGIIGGGVIRASSRM